jgi:putative membrane protein
MKLKILSLALFALITSPLYAAMPVQDNAPNASQTQAASQKEGEIIGFLVVLNKNEISAAKEVSKKKVSAQVKSYAALMKKDHGKNLTQTLKLSKKLNQKPIDNEMIVSLKEKGKQELTTLSALNAMAFEKAYIDDMVKGHEEALVVIDNELPNVTNPALKKHLETTRAAVAQHLEKAKEIQKVLNG